MITKVGFSILQQLTGKSADVDCDEYGVRQLLLYAKQPALGIEELPRFRPWKFGEYFMSTLVLWREADKKELADGLDAKILADR